MRGGLHLYVLLCATLLVEGLIARVSPCFAAVQNQAGPHANQDPQEAAHGLASINWFDFQDSFNPPYIALLVNFAVLLGLFYFFGRRPLTHALQKRRAEIQQAISEAALLKREAQQRAHQYQSKLAQIEKESESIRQACIERGQAARQQLMQEAEQKAERMQKEAEFRILQEEKCIQHELMRKTVHHAIKLAQKQIRTQLTPADHAHFAEAYLIDLLGQIAPTQSSNLSFRQEHAS